jgi:hypothetical protein
VDEELFASLQINVRAEREDLMSYWRQGCIKAVNVISAHIMQFIFGKVTNNLNGFMASIG